MAISTKYTIKNTEGNFSFDINIGSSNGPNEVTQLSDLTFYGYGKTGWGQEVDRNFYRLLENFACTQASEGVPKKQTDYVGGFVGQGINNPIKGQAWFNSTNNELYICTNPTTDSWKHIISEEAADAKFMTAVDVYGSYLGLDGSNSPMTGYLQLYANPVTSMHAATKQYVDNQIAGISLGTGYVAKTGDIMTGGLAIKGGDIPGFSYPQPSAISMGIVSNNAAFEMGNTSGTGTTPYIDFHSSGNNIDFDTRILSDGGTTTPGQGFLQLIGNVISDGRTPATPNQFVTKNWTESLVSSNITALSSSVASIYLPKSGGTLTGALTLNANPSSPLHATTKQYVDTFLVKSGGTMTGPLTLNANPGSAMQAATKQYVDNSIPPALAPTGMRITWVDGVDVATSTYTSYADVKSFSITTPANVTFVMGSFVFLVQHRSHELVVNWKLLWNDVEVGLGFSEGTGDNTIGLTVSIPFYVTVAGNTNYTLKLQAQNRYNVGNVRTNYGQVNNTPTNSNVGSSTVSLVFI
ncbi:MAG: hypothetical protein ACXW2E_02080 [Nitrososphaeraceae archaeon]